MSLKGNGVIGVRREDKNKWERRVPLTPAHVSKLVADGIKVIVQPSNRRCFPDQAYVDAGAELSEDLTPASTILAVKEVPAHLLIPERTYVFFSHTIKAQAENMPLLNTILEKQIRMIDYECITETGSRDSKRLVAFGRYAGIAGAIDFLRGLGERLLARGYSTPFLHVGSTFMYKDLEAAKAAIRSVGEEIKQYGLPAALAPFTFVVTGRGNVSKGSQEIFELLPHTRVDPAELKGLVEGGVTGDAKTKQIFIAQATDEHMVVHKDVAAKLQRELGFGLSDADSDDEQVDISAATDEAEGADQPPKMTGGVQHPRLDGAQTEAIRHAAAESPKELMEAFDKFDYRKNPQNYAPIFHETVLPYTTVLCNCMYWEGAYPRLVTLRQAQRLLEADRLRLEGICEISCDREGSVGFLKQFTSIEHPFYIFDIGDDKIVYNMDAENGILFHAVDHLPSECPEAASEHFGNCLTPFLPALANSDGTKAFDEMSDLPLQLKGAIIAHHGKLTPNFKYIEALRDASDRADARVAARHTEGDHFKSITLRGHLFDKNIISQALDIVEASTCSCRLTDVVVGADMHEETRVGVQVFGESREEIAGVIEQISALVAIAGAAMERSKQSAVKSTMGMTRSGSGSALAALGGGGQDLPQRKVLLLGAGMVTSPFVEYLLRRPENVVTVADMSLEVSKKLCHGRKRMLPVQLNVVAEAEKLEDLIKEHDCIVSLVPAQFHTLVAEPALKHKRNMVTASYISPAMYALHDQAVAAKVCILNESGLDPGIDHLSACKMLREIEAVGGKIVTFSSLCGGLPAPEAANNPLGYKFSWSPRGVLTAARNAAKFLEGGKVVEVPGEALLANAKHVYINPAFNLEVLPNRDSLPYMERYGLKSVQNMFRGTLRYKGYSNIIYSLACLGLLVDEPRDYLTTGNPTRSRRTVVAEAAHVNPSVDDTTLTDAIVATMVGGPAHGFALDAQQVEALQAALIWLELYSDKPMPQTEGGIPLDSVCSILTSNPAMSYAKGERDMCLMHHVIEAEYPDGSFKRHEATMVQYGDERGTSMARTVGITAAIGTQLIMDGTVRNVGVHAPLTKEWFNPMLKALEAEGISLKEKTTVIRGPKSA